MSSSSPSESSDLLNLTREDGPEIARLRRDVKRLEEAVEGKKRKAPYVVPFYLTSLYSRSHSKVGSPGRVIHKSISLFEPIASLIYEADTRKSKPTRIFADDAEHRA